VGYTLGGNIQWQSSTTPSNFANVATGGNSASYSTTILTQTTYYRALVTSGLCTGTSDTVKISVIAAPQGTFTFTTNGTTASFNSSGISGATGFSWNFGDGTPISSQANPTHTFDSTNVVYEVCVTATNSSNCNYFTCQNVTVFPLGVNNITLENAWQIYPDPFTNQLYINSTSASQGIQQIEIYDVLGRVVLQQRIGGSSAQPLQIDVSSLQQGVYFLRIDSPAGSFEKSLIKE
jgi:PKD repeat protein